MENFKTTIEIKRNLEIDEEMLTDLLSSIWTAISYWASDIDYNEEEYEKEADMLRRSGIKKDDIVYEQVLVRMMINEQPLMIHDAEEDKIYELTLDKFLSGIQQYLSSEYCKEYDKDLEDYDDITVDNIVQYSLFDDIIYG